MEKMQGARGQKGNRSRGSERQNGRGVSGPRERREKGGRVRGAKWKGCRES
jgi:hypothetical protein